MQQKGISELFLESLTSVHPDIQKLLLKNVLVCGGLSKIPGLLERLADELRENLPHDMMFQLNHQPDELFYTNKMAEFVKSDLFSSNVISKKMYEEYGSLAICHIID